MAADLSTRFAGLELKNPLVIASSGLTENVARMAKAQEAGAAAVVMKSLFEEEVCRTAPTPRYRIIRHDLQDRRTFTFFSYEQASEWGPVRYAEEVASAKRELHIKILPSLNCLKLETWLDWAKMMEQAGADALELNTSCPHGSITFRGRRVEESIVEVVEGVKKAVSIPVIAKISPMLTSPVGLVKLLADAGVDGVTVFNRLTGLDVDLEEERPIMHGSYAGHGGPWALLYPLRWISAIRPQVGISIAGSGGVSSGEDLAKYILVGADAVQVCTAVYMEGFEVIGTLLDGLAEWMEQKGYDRLDEFRGRVNEQILATEDVDRSKRFQAEIDVSLAAPCRAACPDGVAAQGYVRLAAQGRFEDAFRLIKQNDPFQRTLGHICNHFCEQDCTRAAVDAPVGIREIKRAVVEWGLAKGLDEDVAQAEPNGKNAAVVGSGPAGLAAAFELARTGYSVTVFDKEEKLGGLMRYAIPRFRLPEEVVDYDVERVLGLGVETKTSTIVEDAAGLRKEFDAVVLAVGAGDRRRLGVPGEDLDGVIDAIEFLHDVSTRAFERDLGRVAVIGGGNSAVDAARTALRLGAKCVYLAYRRGRREMPSLAEEVDSAEAEGVRLLTQVVPVELAGKGEVEAVRLAPAYLGDADTSGRRRPVSAEDAGPFTLAVETVIAALGQSVAKETAGVDLSDPAGLAAQGIFLAGDCVIGPASVVQAVASGRNAAAALDRFLRGEDAAVREAREYAPVVKQRVLERLGDWTPQDRREAEHLPPGGPADLSHAAISVEQAKREGSRCLACGCGTGCDRCVTVCLHDAVYSEGGRNYIDPEKCEGCGMCVEICPNGNMRLVEREE